MLPRLLLTKQEYSPLSAVVTESMVKTLPLKWEGTVDGSVQVYEGLGFPTAVQFSFRGSPFLTVISDGGVEMS